MKRKKNTGEPQGRRSQPIEVDRVKHRKYKLHAVKNGLTMKEMTEAALDEFLGKK